MNIEKDLLTLEITKSCDCAAEVDHDGKVKAMNWVPVIWSVWGVSMLLMAGVILYASRLAKNEEDQLFLAESSSHERTEQAAIATRVEKVQPLKKMTMVLAGAATLVVLVYYVFDVIHQFQ
jgi:hypothetical protein